MPTREALGFTPGFPLLYLGAEGLAFQETHHLVIGKHEVHEQFQFTVLFHDLRDDNVPLFLIRTESETLDPLRRLVGPIEIPVDVFIEEVIHDDPGYPGTRERKRAVQLIFVRIDFVHDLIDSEIGSPNCDKSINEVGNRVLLVLAVLEDISCDQSSLGEPDEGNFFVLLKRGNHREDLIASTLYLQCDSSSLFCQH